MGYTFVLAHFFMVEPIYGEAYLKWDLYKAGSI